MMSNFLRRRALACVAAISLVISSCGSDEGKTSTSSTLGTSPATTPLGSSPPRGGSTPITTGSTSPESQSYSPKGTLRVGMQLKTVLSPFLDAGSHIQGISPLMYETLVRRNRDGSFGPGLAESWKFSDDGLSVTFVLRDGIEFSDGEPFNAAAVKAQIEYVQTAPIDQVLPQIAQSFARVKSVKVVDDLTVTMELTGRSEVPLLIALHYQAGFMVSPKSLGNVNQSPVGTGPYIYNRNDSASDNTSMTFDANPNYWQPGLVGLEHVEVTFIPDIPARAQAFDAGQFDLVFAFPSMGSPKSGDWVYTSNVESVQYMFLVTDWQGKRVPQLANRDVRCAIQAAINREGIARLLKQDPSTARTQWAAGPDQYGYIEDLKLPTFDIAAAKAAFAASGEAPFALSTGYIAGSTQDTTVPPLVGTLKELGITLTAEAVQPGTGAEMAKRLAAGVYPIQIIPFNDGDPLLVLKKYAAPDGALNLSKTAPPGVAELIASASQKSAANAEADIAAAWKIMLEECILLPVIGLTTGFWVSPKVTGFEAELGATGWKPIGVRIKD